jgi:phytoene synthase
MSAEPIGRTAADAYAACEQITRREAKNFYYGIRLLPPDKRSALCALYALARRIDDIGDGDLSPGAKAEALTRLRTSLHDTVDPTGDPVLFAVADAARRYPVPIDAFGELIDGVQQDVDGIRYADFAVLTGYCRCVAGTVGRLCLSIFGSGTDPNAPLYADQLGIALQQTNILRDIREDLLHGRVYLPGDELDRFGVRLELDPSGALRDPDGRLAALIRHAADRAENWYCLGWRLVPQLDGRSAACCAAMAGIYRRLNARIRDNPVIVYDRRLSLTGLEKTRVASGTLLHYSTAALAGQLSRRGPQRRGAAPPDPAWIVPEAGAVVSQIGSAARRSRTRATVGGDAPRIGAGTQAPRAVDTRVDGPPTSGSTR